MPLDNPFDFRGKTVVLVFCGSNIDWETFAAQVVFEEAKCWSTN